MQDRREKRHCVDPRSRHPRVWVKSFNRGDRGRPLFEEQTVRDALGEIGYLPSIGLACPMIPEKAPGEIPFGDDISIIGLQHGMIATKTASIPKVSRRRLAGNLKVSTLPNCQQDVFGSPYNIPRCLTAKN